MKPIEFYEKYWKIKQPDGSVGSPKITDKDKFIFNLAEKLNVQPYLVLKKRDGSTAFIIHPLIEDELKKSKQHTEGGEYFYKTSNKIIEIGKTAESKTDEQNNHTQEST